MSLTRTFQRTVVGSAVAALGLTALATTVSGSSAQAGGGDLPPLMWQQGADDGNSVVTFYSDGREIALPGTQGAVAPSTGHTPSVLTYNAKVNQRHQVFAHVNGVKRQLTHTDRVVGLAHASPVRPSVVYSEKVQGEHEIYTVELNGERSAALTARGGNWHPVWSPDGSKIAFLSDRNGTWGLFEMNADGSNERLVKAQAMGRPSYSPDGNQILYTAPGFELASVNVNTGAVQQLTHTPNVMEYQGAYSPDGQHIAHDAYDEAANSYRVYVMSARGGPSNPVSRAGVVALYPNWVNHAEGQDPGGLPVPEPRFGDGEEQEPAPGQDVPVLPNPRPVPGDDDNQAEAGGPSFLLKGKPKDGENYGRRAVKRIKGISAAGAGIKWVKVAMKVKKGRECRHLRKNGRLTRTKKCRSRFVTAARQAGPFKQKVKRLPKGEYKLIVKVRDREGEVIKHRLRFRVGR